MDISPEITEIGSKKIKCMVSSAGASILQVSVQGSCNQFVNVALPLAPCAAGRDASYAGAMLGPCAGRIRGGLVTLGNVEYHLAQNDGENTLHGGPHGVSSQLFRIEEKAADSIRLSTYLPDGLDGWPGNRNVSVQISIGPGGMLSLQYEATSDRPTWLDLSHHLYWNLNGDFSMPGTSQYLQIPAEEVLYNNTFHLPCTKSAVASTPFDFRAPREIAAQMAAFPQNLQLKNAHGYNNAYLLPKGASPAARLWNHAQTLGLELFTDQPALVLYSGGYLGPDTTLLGGRIAYPGCAIALEAQNWPDAPHFPGAPFIPLRPGQVYRRRISYRFFTGQPCGQNEPQFE